MERGGVPQIGVINKSGAGAKIEGSAKVSKPGDA